MQPPDAQPHPGHVAGAAPHSAIFGGEPSASGQRQHGAAGAAASAHVNGQAGLVRQETRAPVQADAGEQAFVQPAQQAQSLKHSPEAFVEEVALSCQYTLDDRCML